MTVADRTAVMQTELGVTKSMADRTDSKSAMQTDLKKLPFLQTELQLNQKKIKRVERLV